MGDNLVDDSGVFSLDGSALSEGGFDTALFEEDYGTLEWDANDDAQFDPDIAYLQIEGYPPASNACQEALANLNAAFLNFMIAGFSSVIGGTYAGIVAKAVKVGVITGTGVAASSSGTIASLNAAQFAVNLECAGQGAGQNPNGPLPPGYAPGT